jgi:hypothetical protein
MCHKTVVGVVLKRHGPLESVVHRKVHATFGGEGLVFLSVRTRPLTLRRRSDDLPGGLGKPVVGPRVTGEPLEPDAATRNADRPKGEKRELASRLPGNSYGRF